MRDGKIASYSIGLPRDREKFLVNTNVYAGDSGGPVFAARRRGPPKLVGMMTERVGEKPGSVPLAIAVDASVVRETLQLLAQREANSAANAQTSKSPNAQRPATVKLIGPQSLLNKVLRAKSRAQLRSR